MGFARRNSAPSVCSRCLRKRRDIHASSCRRPNNYPLGHSTGKPFDLDDQVGIVRASLGMLESATAGSTMLDLPNSWEDIAPGWEDRAYRRGTPEAEH